MKRRGRGPQHRHVCAAEPGCRVHPLPPCPLRHPYRSWSRAVAPSVARAHVWRRRDSRDAHDFRGSRLARWHSSCWASIFTGCLLWRGNARRHALPAGISWARSPAPSLAWAPRASRHERRLRDELHGAWYRRNVRGCHSSAGHGRRLAFEPTGSLEQPSKSLAIVSVFTCDRQPAAGRRLLRASAGIASALRPTRHEHWGRTAASSTHTWSRRDAPRPTSSSRRRLARTHARRSGAALRTRSCRAGRSGSSRATASSSCSTNTKETTTSASCATLPYGTRAARGRGVGNKQRRKADFKQPLLYIRYNIALLMYISRNRESLTRKNYANRQEPHVPCRARGGNRLSEAAAIAYKRRCPHVSRTEESQALPQTCQARHDIPLVIQPSEPADRR